VSAFQKVATFQINGNGPIWDAGGRWQPNPDSNIVLLYGRHELNDDFSGQAVWQITPITEFTARYIDAVGNPQSSLLSGGLGSSFGGGFGAGFLGNPGGPGNFTKEGQALADVPVVLCWRDGSLQKDFDWLGHGRQS